MLERMACRQLEERVVLEHEMNFEGYTDSLNFGRFPTESIDLNR